MSASDQPVVMRRPGDRVKNKYTGAEYEIVKVDDTGGCTLQTRLGKVYYDCFMMSEHWDLVK
jgi:hypothetical protein